MSHSYGKILHWSTASEDGKQGKRVDEIRAHYKNIKHGVNKEGAHARGTYKGHIQGAHGRGTWKGHMEGAHTRGTYKGHIQGAHGRGTYKGHIQESVVKVRMIKWWRQLE